MHTVLGGCVMAAMVLGAMGTGAAEERYGDLDAAAVRARSVVDAGQAYRVQPALAKARRGERVVIGAIGGSITQGAVASKPEFRWANRVAQWWTDTFPQAEIVFVNAGIGATGSDIGAHRAQAHLLKDTPDFVLVEYAVNDSIVVDRDETLEGLLRQVLGQPNRPGAMMLFTMNKQGENVQDQHIPVGRHYGLPMVSFRDGIYPEVAAGRVAWEAIEGDDVHPNDRGHGLCADLLIQVLERYLADLPAEGVAEAPPLPAPLISDVFEHTALRSRDDLVPVRSEGWEPVPGAQYGGGWAAEKPGSVIEFEVEGTDFGLLFWRIKGPMGIAEAQVDDAPPVRLEAWFNADWGGFTRFEFVARHLAPGKHRLRVTVLEDQQPGSDGHRFEIQGIACAGVGREPR